MLLFTHTHVFVICESCSLTVYLRMTILSLQVHFLQFCGLKHNLRVPLLNFAQIYNANVCEYCRTKSGPHRWAVAEHVAPLDCPW